MASAAMTKTRGNTGSLTTFIILYHIACPSSKPYPLAPELMLLMRERD